VFAAKVWILSSALATVLLVSATGRAAATPANSRAVHSVTIEDMQFKPSQLTVHPGDRIVFSNKDLFPHTVTAQDGKSFDSHDIAPNASWSYRAAGSGVYSYRCTLHPTMRGQLTVR